MLYTFSRNPKIAAFLKDYGYVKEYGEGVDRMCKELESVGLSNPDFNNSTFILKKVVMSGAYHKASIDASIRQNDAMIYYITESRKCINIRERCGRSKKGSWGT